LRFGIGPKSVDSDLIPIWASIATLYLQVQKTNCTRFNTDTNLNPIPISISYRFQYRNRYRYLGISAEKYRYRILNPIPFHHTVSDNNTDSPIHDIVEWQRIWTWKSGTYKMFWHFLITKGVLNKKLRDAKNASLSFLFHSDSKNIHIFAHVATWTYR
jgi:hypothetical protein